MGLLDSIKGALLGGVDRLNMRVNPYEPFTRPARVVDWSTLDEKENHYYWEIQRHWIKGPELEFYWHVKPNDLGDMAIWQGCYVAMLAMKGVDRPLRRAFEGLVRLQTLGGDNRLARGADKKSGDHALDPSRTYFTDGDYVFTGQVSESTLIGHLYGLWAVLQFDTPQDLKTRARALCRSLAAQIVKDGYRLLDYDGTPAKFGDLRPSLTTAPIRIAALCAALLLGGEEGEDVHLQQLYHKIASEHRGSLSHLESHFLFIDPAYDDILAYMVLTILLTRHRYKDKVSKAYSLGLDLIWEKTKHQGNSFYNYTHNLLTRATPPAYLDQAAISLAEFNTVEGKGHPTHKEGIERRNPRVGIEWTSWGFGRYKKDVARQPLPVWARPAADFVWQRNPYHLDGWIGHKTAHHHFNGMDYCLAYWLGKKVGAL